MDEPALGGSDGKDHLRSTGEEKEDAAVCRPSSLSSPHPALFPSPLPPLALPRPPFVPPHAVNSW